MKKLFLVFFISFYLSACANSNNNMERAMDKYYKVLDELKEKKLKDQK